MQRPKIYASAISNLSDARYFAAMGVDVMGFEVGDNTDIKAIQEILSWVEGPEIALEVTTNTWTSGIIAIVEAIKPSIITLPMYWEDLWHYSTLSILARKHISENIHEDIRLVRVVDKTFDQLTKGERANLTAPQTAYIDALWSMDDLQFASAHLPNAGIVLRGGEEIATGIKSFDQMDAIFDYLEEQYG